MARTPAPEEALDGRGFRLGFAVARFHGDVTEAMLEAAQARARSLGVQVVAILDVAGVYDLPLAVQTLLRRPDADGAVALGAIVTGETGHDELIGHACAQALVRLALDHGKPVGLGITGPRQTLEQARARIDRAASAVDAAVRLLKSLGKLPSPKGGHAAPRTAAP